MSGSLEDENKEQGKTRVRYDTVGSIPVLFSSILEENFNLFKNFQENFREYREIVTGHVLPYFSAERWPIACVDVGINGRELTSGFIPIICGVAGLFQGSSLVSEPIAGVLEGLGFWNNVSRPRLKASILGYYLQFEIGSRVLDLWHPDLLLLDGPLIVPSHMKLLGLKEDVEKLSKSIVRLLSKALEMGIPVVGFVKRSRSMILSRMLRLKLRDSALLSQVLDIGEFTRPIEITDLAISRYGRFIDDGGEAFEELYCLYMKSIGGRVFRLDVSGWERNDITTLVSLLYHLAEPSSGVPVPLMIVDEYSRVTDRVADNVLLSFISRVFQAVRDGELTSDVLKLIVLQYGERAVGGGR